jgi:release factor glutamine methyltransferase
VWKARRLVDVGCGAGVGGLVLAPRATEVVLADVSPRALELARVSVALNSGDTAISLCQSDVLAQIAGDFDVVIANPPYLVDASPGQAGRLYRDGGGPLGLDLAVRIVTESLSRLGAAAGGQLVLYSGVPIIEGRNVLADRVEDTLRAHATRWRWEELDPDVFSEELDRPPYRDTERLAVMLLTAEID